MSRFASPKHVPDYLVEGRVNNMLVLVKLDPGADMTAVPKRLVANEAPEVRTLNAKASKYCSYSLPYC